MKRLPVDFSEPLQRRVESRVANFQVTRLDLVCHGLRTIGVVTAQGDDLDAAFFELWNQGFEFSQVLRANWAVQPPVEHNEIELLGCLGTQVELFCVDQGDDQRRDGLAGR